MNILILIVVLAVGSSLPLAASSAVAQEPVDSRMVGEVDTPSAGTESRSTVVLTLEQAIDEALEGNRGLGASRARSEAAGLAADAAGGFLFPSVQATAGVVRTDDPVAAFGTTLRQRRFTQADFAIDALNDPGAVTDWTAGVGARWDIGRLDRWVERQAGSAEARAARAGVERQREATVYRTRLLYVNAVRSEARLGALEAATASAHATAERVRRRVGEGMGTQADLLQSAAALSDMEARLEHARAAVMDAREALGSWLGWSVDRVPVPSDDPPLSAFDEDPDTTEATTGLMRRADLVAGRAQLDAADARARMVTAKRLPSLQLFAQLGTHAPRIGAGREHNWTVGAQIAVPVFTGLSLTRGAAAAHAQARAAELEQAQRETDARTELRSARRSVSAARAALASARAARTSADEAARLLRRRYEEGMATVADLLQAEARAAELGAAAVDAEADLSMALATLAFVRGDAAASTPEAP